MAIRLSSALADWLIPAHGDLPSASEAGVVDRYLERALAIRPDLEEPLGRALAAVHDAAPDEIGVRIEALAAADPMALDALDALVEAAWLMSPRVRRRLGYRAHLPDPVLEGEAEHDLDGDLLAPVLARGELA